MTLLVDAASTPADAERGDLEIAPGRAVGVHRRGRTTIATAAIESIAGQVAVETPQVSAARLTGVRGWFSSGRADQADVHVDDTDEGLHIAVEIAVRYPSSVQHVADEVRRRIVAAIDQQLAMTVERVDITVVELRREAQPRLTMKGRVR